MAVTNITEEVSAMREHMKTCEKEVEICDLPVFCVTFGQNHVDPYFHKNMKNVWMKVYAPDIHMVVNGQASVLKTISIHNTALMDVMGF